MQRTERVCALRQDAPGWHSDGQFRIGENHLKFSATHLEDCSAQLHTSERGQFWGRRGVNRLLHDSLHAGAISHSQPQVPHNRIGDDDTGLLGFRRTTVHGAEATYTGKFTATLYWRVSGNVLPFS